MYPMHGTNPLLLQGSPSQNSFLIVWTWVYISFESSSLLSQNNALRSNKKMPQPQSSVYPSPHSPNHPGLGAGLTAPLPPALDAAVDRKLISILVIQSILSLSLLAANNHVLSVP